MTKKMSDWRAEAACRGLAQLRGNHDLFYEEEHELEAKQVCASCNVRLDCLRWALKNFEHHPHVIGGMNPSERDRAWARYLKWSRRRERTDEAWRQWERKELA